MQQFQLDEGTLTQFLCIAASALVSLRHPVRIRSRESAHYCTEEPGYYKYDDPLRIHAVLLPLDIRCSDIRGIRKQVGSSRVRSKYLARTRKANRAACKCVNKEEFDAFNRMQNLEYVFLISRIDILYFETLQKRIVCWKTWCTDLN